MIHLEEVIVTVMKSVLVVCFETVVVLVPVSVSSEQGTVVYVLIVEVMVLSEDEVGALVTVVISLTAEDEPMIARP